MSQDAVAETITPQSIGDAARAIADAAAQRRAIYSVGGRTHFEYGCPPGRPGIALCTTAMQEVIDYSFRDLTITVGAGMRLHRLAEILAQQSQFLPIDFVFGGDSTIGGMVAWSPPGPRSYRWGSIRDYVLGMRAIDGDGRSFCVGGRVVKNAAGYNVTRLLTGSWGTLALIGEVTLMVRPLPEQRRLWSWSVKGPEELERLLSCLIASRCEPSAIEVIGGTWWDREPVLATVGENGPFRVAVVLEGAARELDGLWDTLWRELTEAELRIGEEIPVESYDRLSGFLAEIPRSGVVYELDVRPSRVVAGLELLSNLRPRASYLAHAGTGKILVFEESGDEFTPEVAAQLRAAVMPLDGRLVVLRFPWSGTWERVAVWGPVSPTGRYMQGLKDRFDPHGILNPGRYVFPP